MSSTSSEYQRGLEEGLRRCGPGDPVAIADARAESYRKGWEDALEEAADLLDKETALAHIGRWLRFRAQRGPTAPQAPLHPPAPPETPEPATAQHSGSQAYRENDDGA